MIRLVVGLGNPGPSHAATRHNAGFWFADAVARKLGVSLAADRAYAGLVARTQVAGRPLWLLEPTTFMNLSGKSVAALARFYKIAPEEIVVAYDELDLPPGQARFKQGGSRSTHNGVRDIVDQLGSGDFWRLRLGIGHPGVKSEVADYVLRKPPPVEREAIEASVARSLSALDLVLDGEMDRATMAINARPPKLKDDASKAQRAGPATKDATAKDGTAPAVTGDVAATVDATRPFVRGKAA